MKGQRILCGSILFLGLCHFSTLDALTLVRHKKALATIYIAKPADPEEKLSAEEFANYVQKISGVRLEIRELSADEKPDLSTAQILLGRCAFRFALDPPPKSPSGEGYSVKITRKQLLAGGETPAGTLHAVYDILERMGYAWSARGGLSEVRDGKARKR